MAVASLTKLLVLVAVGDAGAAGAADGGVSTDEAVAQVAAAKVPEPPLPAVAFPLKRKPRATRTQAWTRQRQGFAPGWEGDYPEVHFSRFFDLAHPRLHPPWVHDPAPEAWRRSLFRFAAAVIADLRRALVAACPAGRCRPELTQVAQRLTDFVKAHPRDLTFVEQPFRATPFYAWDGWQISTGELSFSVGCHDMVESPEAWCELEVALSDDLLLSYAPKTAMSEDGAEITLFARADPKRVGEIRFDRTDAGAPVAIIGGIALAEARP